MPVRTLNRLPRISRMRTSRQLSEGMIQFQRLLGHVRSKISSSNPRVVAKAAAAVRKEIMEKHPGVNDHKKVTDESIKAFDANMDKYVKLAEQA